MSTLLQYDRTKFAVKYAENSKLNINWYFASGDNSPFRIFVKMIPDLMSLVTEEVQRNFSGINIIFEDSYVPDAFELESAILITTGLLEHLWISSYLHYSLYLQTSFGNPKVSENSQEIVWTTEMKACLRRLEASYEEKCAGWPTELPVPTCEYDVRSGRIEDLATEMSLHTLMCIMLHEGKHYIDYMNGYRGRSNMRIEAAADDYAIESFMKIPDVESLEEGKRDRAYQKRIQALLEMGVFLSSCELGMTEEDDIHPNGIYRIHNVLKKQSCIFNYVNDVDYDPAKDITDIRPLIQYAAFVLNADASIVLPDGSQIKEELYSMISNNVYEHPLSFYKELIFFFAHHLFEIHDAQYQQEWIKTIRELDRKSEKTYLVRF